MCRHMCQSSKDKKKSMQNFCRGVKYLYIYVKKMSFDILFSLLSTDSEDDSNT